MKLQEQDERAKALNGAVKVVARARKGSGINGYVDMIKHQSLPAKQSKEAIFGMERSLSPIAAKDREASTSLMSGIISVQTANKPMQKGQLESNKDTVVVDHKTKSDNNPEEDEHK